MSLNAYCKQCEHPGVAVEKSGFCRFCENDNARPQSMKDFELINPNLFLQHWENDVGKMFKIASMDSRGAINFYGPLDLSENTLKELYGN